MGSISRVYIMFRRLHAYCELISLAHSDYPIGLHLRVEVLLPQFNRIKNEQ